MTRLDELSKKLLGRYINKAANKAALAHGDTITARKDRESIENATNVLGLLNKDKIRDLARVSTLPKEKKGMHTAAKRLVGISKATARLTKEETEEMANQIDELTGKGKLAGIVKLHRKELNKAKGFVRYNYHKDKVQRGEKLQQTAAKRSLAKEEIEEMVNQIEEIAQLEENAEIQLHPVQDFINHTMAERPSEASSSFEDILHGIIKDKIAQRKLELQNEFLGVEAPEVEEEEVAEEETVEEGKAPPWVKDKKKDDDDDDDDDKKSKSKDSDDDDDDDDDSTTIVCKKKIKEETQIDELSKGKLFSYMNKTIEKGETEKRKKGMSQANSKLNKMRPKVSTWGKGRYGEAKEETQIDELSGKTLGSYIQKARQDYQKKNEHSRFLSNHPDVKRWSARRADYYNRKEYDSRGGSVHRDKIDNTYKREAQAKTKLDPNYLKNTDYSKRYKGIEKAVKKLQFGKLTD